MRVSGNLAIVSGRIVHLGLKSAVLAALVGVSGCSTSPNTGLPGDRWSSVEGAIVGDVRLQPVASKGPRVFRTIRPSQSEQGMEQGVWEVSYVVLVPGPLKETRGNERGPFSKEVSDALLRCALTIGSFPVESAWRSRPDLAFKTGVVKIGGRTFYQYQTHYAKWRLLVSNTGRGYRISDFRAQVFGAISRVPRGRNVRTTVSVGYAPFNHETEKAAEITFSPLSLDSITAKCGNGGLRLSGPTARLEDGVWREAIMGQPFNAVVDVSEEVMR